jgi:hypothetical protein
MAPKKDPISKKSAKPAAAPMAPKKDPISKAVVVAMKRPASATKKPGINMMYVLPVVKSSDAGCHQGCRLRGLNEPN